MQDLITTLNRQLGDDVLRPQQDIGERHYGDHSLTADADTSPLALAYPRSTADVSAILAECNKRGIPVVTQGGLTGLAGGGTPTPGALLLSLERMNAIEGVDTAASTLIVQAGVTLQNVQEAAEAAGLMFALDLGARGSCQIGGNAATNAGGNRVLRYGMMRQLVLGLEVVLADGTVLTSMNRMLKNNSGYDLKQVFIGSEGTLGVITRLVLRLHPRPTSRSTALCAVPDYASVLKLLHRARTDLGDKLSAFEMMWPDYYRLATEGAGRRPPLPHDAGIFVLFETLGNHQEKDQTDFEESIAAAIDEGTVTDAVIAQSLNEALAMWAIRESTGEAARLIKPYTAFDVSIPIGSIGAFIEDCTARLNARWPGTKTSFFGHVADSNIHISVHVNETPMPSADIYELVFGVLAEYDGAISAEHGIGVQKKKYLAKALPPEAIDAMRRLKQAFDPAGILNPGKVFDPA